MEESNRELALGIALIARDATGNETDFLEKILALRGALERVLPISADKKTGKVTATRNIAAEQRIIEAVPTRQRILATLKLGTANFPRPPAQPNGARTERIEILLSTLQSLGYSSSGWTSVVHEGDFQRRQGLRFGFLEGDWLCVQSLVESAPWTLWVSAAATAETYFLPRNLPKNLAHAVRTSWDQITEEHDLQQIAPLEVVQWRAKIKRLLALNSQPSIGDNSQIEIDGETYVSLCAYAATFSPPINHEALKHWVQISGAQPHLVRALAKNNKSVDVFLKSAVDAAIPPLLSRNGIVDLGNKLGKAISIPRYARYKKMSAKALERLIIQYNVQPLHGRSAQIINTYGKRCVVAHIYAKWVIDAIIQCHKKSGHSS